jgi:hypothetical protein
MNRRVVKPPPRVTPQIVVEDRPSEPSPQNNKISTDDVSKYDFSQEPDYEFLVQQEMARMKLEYEEIARQEMHEASSHRLNVSSDLPNQKYQSPSRKVVDIPQEMYAGNHSELFDHQDHYAQSPRRAKGGLSDLYGPDDDRQNLKAAKAAAYSHQVPSSLSLCLYLSQSHSLNNREINSSIRTSTTTATTEMILVSFKNAIPSHNPILRTTKDEDKGTFLLIQNPIMKEDLLS